MKIGLIKETKTPVDNRVALSPQQVAEIMSRFPLHEIVVQSSDIRAYSDAEYREKGIQVVADVSDCDMLLGIKEAAINTLIPNKHYVFFGHIAKMQAYNKPLIQSMIHKKLTFSDYEYMVDENNQRVCAFGWWAGVVGVYYTLRGYGLKTRKFSLPKPDIKFSLASLLENIKRVELPAIQLLVTGNGRVSKGAQYVLEEIGAEKLTEEAFLSNDNVNKLSYTVAVTDQLVRHIENKEFSNKEFKASPELYRSDFMRWARKADVLISAHYWDNAAPVYLGKNDLRDKDLKISMIGDVTCDIMGCLKSTLRASTHNNPYYDYNPITESEEPAFSSDSNITVMAVDTCPNALPRDTSEYFGSMLIKHVIAPLFEGKCSSVLDKSTIIREGELTDHFSYLHKFAK